MLALATAVAAVTTGFVQPPVVMGGSAIAPARQMPPIMSAEAPSGRRAAIGAGAAAAAALMMPGLANAEVSQARMDELMAEERAKAAEKATAVQDDEKKYVKAHAASNPALCVWRQLPLSLPLHAKYMRC